MVKLNFIVPILAFMAAQVVHSATTTSKPTASTSQLPPKMTPSGGAGARPPKSTLVQVGFKYELNYPFVARNQAASAQIFKLTPVGVAYALNIDTKVVVMDSLKPLDTQSTLGYITTVALFYIPAASTSAFRANVLNPGSRLYHQPNETVNSLMNLINPDISTVPS